LHPYIFDRERSKVKDQGQGGESRENAKIVVLAVTPPQIGLFASSKDQNVS